MNHTMILNTMTNVKVLSFGEDLGEVLGNAVYTVRVMLNIDPTNLNLEYAKPPVHNQPIVTENTVKVYPNPAKDHFVVEYNVVNDLNNATIDVVDMLGHKMQSNKLTAKTGQITINTGSYAKSMYVCFLKNNGKIISKTKVAIE